MWRRLIDINLTGSFMVSQAVGRALMAENKPGSIILVASMSGSIVNYPQEQSCYNASKAGVIQLGKSLAAEWAKYGIRVNCISPGKFSLYLPITSFLSNDLQVTWTLH
jgi:NAD(P)-dependent dehydrogenase (short-subunit alcohol dehydrogenase family)